MKRTLTTLFFSLALTLAGSLSGSACAYAAVDTLTPAQRTAVENYARKLLASPQIVGFSLAVAHDGKLVFAHGYGFANRTTRMPATAFTRYGIGSVTKQFVAALVMRSVVAGKLALDDRLAQVLPNFPHAGEISIRQILDQTSGLPDYALQIDTFAPHNGTRNDPTSAIRGLPLHFRPGTQFEYSNTNYLAAGMVVEKLSGRRLGHVLAESIFRPLRMTSTRYGAPLGPQAAPRHRPGAANAMIATAVGSLDWAAGAGAMSATAGDVVRWDLGFFGGTILPPSAVEVSIEPPQLGGGQRSYYAFGWVVSNPGEHRMIWHNGAIFDGYTAMNAVFPDDKLAIAVLANSHNEYVADPSQIFAIASAFISGLPAPRTIAALPADDPAVDARARAFYDELRGGTLDRNQLTVAFKRTLSAVKLDDMSRLLRTAGAPAAFVFAGRRNEHGFITSTYDVYFAGTPGFSVKYEFMVDSVGKVAAINAEIEA